MLGEATMGGKYEIRKKQAHVENTTEELKKLIMKRRLSKE